MLPFRGQSTREVFESILNQTPVPAVRLNADVAPELQSILSKCLEKNPELRYQHASDIRADLQRLRRDTESSKAAAAAESTVLKYRPGHAVLTVGYSEAIVGWCKIDCIHQPGRARKGYLFLKIRPFSVSG